MMLTSLYLLSLYLYAEDTLIYLSTLPKSVAHFKSYPMKMENSGPRRSLVKTSVNVWTTPSQKLIHSKGLAGEERIYQAKDIHPDLFLSSWRS